MMELPSSPLLRRRFAKRGAFARILRRTLYFKLSLLVVIGLGLGILYLRLAAGPLSFGRLPERVASSLAARIGPGWNVALRDTALQLDNGSLALRATGLDIRNPDGALVLRAPDAVVSVDGLSLLSASLQPRSIEFRDLQIRASLHRDGSLSFLPNQDIGGATPAEPSQTTQPMSPTPSAAPAGRIEASPVSVAVGSLLDLVVGQGGILGALDNARVTNARLTIVDENERERTTFNRVDASFHRTDAGGRRFEATLDGPGGPWQLSGDALVDGVGGYHASIVAADAPAQDVLLLSGLSAIPATTDLELSGRIDAMFAGGRATELKASFTSNAGRIQIQDKDTGPWPVERLAIEAAWDEGRRALVLQTLDIKGSDTQLRLSGELTVPTDEPGWRLALSGRNGAIAGAAAGDGPVRIDTMDARFRVHEGLSVEALTLRGPNVALDLTGRLGQPADPQSLKLDVSATNTDVRSALRLWPEAVASGARRYLVRSLTAGMVERIAVRVDMSGADLSAAMHGGPIPDSAVRVDFAVARGRLTVAEGLPSLVLAAPTGFVTGARVAIQAPSGSIEMPDGRTLTASDGSFVLDNVWLDQATARIGFRLQGGADGLGSLLQVPMLHELVGLDFEAGGMKGRADLRVAVPLPVRNIPKLADLPLSVTGTVNDLSIDRVFGKDRLEGTNLSVSYDQGNLAIKGEGKLAGSPAAIDVRKSRESGGEANVAFALDDAARTRRGLSFGSQLTGPVQLKAIFSLGESPKPGMRIEADLTKATIDQAIPGWVKPAGRPGKLVLAFAEGSTNDIRDLQIDSGSVQLRGSALLSADGNLEKADLTTLKFSQGDDMWAQLDRVSGVYKVTVRGNVGDARPFTRDLGTSTQSNTRAAAQRDSRDFDLDLAVNILTGHNDEAITNATMKVSVRKENIRHLDLAGRLGASNILGQTVTRAGTSPVILMQADDAGAVLRFLDIYRRMAGGDLVMQMATGDGPQAGFLTAHDFTLRNEPALRRIIPTQTQVVEGQDRAGNPQAVRIDLNEVTFAKARVDFTRSAGRVDFKDAAIWGAQVGFTLGGFIDYARDRMDIAGTFVPAYGLNNAFAQVPLFGPLLGGGQYEGLFAVNFRISGQTSAPVLTVNPLSAVAPGFLRKLFGVGSAPQTGAVPAPIPER